MQYKLLKEENGQDRQDAVLKLPNTFIPNDPANHDWRDYQAWLAQGNEPEPADPVEPAE